MALAATERRARRNGLSNITLVPAHGYSTGVPAECADMVLALDMFHGISDPAALLGEIRRILRPGGTFILEDGHQPRAIARAKISAAGGWQIHEECVHHLVFRPE